MENSTYTARFFADKSSRQQAVVLGIAILISIITLPIIWLTSPGITSPVALLAIVALSAIACLMIPLLELLSRITLDCLVLVSRKWHSRG